MNESRGNEVLLTCPRCGTPNFTKRGLRSHYCAGISRESGMGERLEKRRLTEAEFNAACSCLRRMSEDRCDEWRGTDPTNV